MTLKVNCQLNSHLLLQVQAALLHAIIKLHPEGGIQHIHQQLETLQAAKPSLAAVKPLWLTISAAAAAAGPEAAASAKGFVEEWMTDADLESADVTADLLGVEVLQLQHTKQSLKVCRYCCTTCCNKLLPRWNYQSAIVISASC